MRERFALLSFSFSRFLHSLLEIFVVYGLFFSFRMADLFVTCHSILTILFLLHSLFFLFFYFIQLHRSFCIHFEINLV